MSFFIEGGCGHLQSQHRAKFVDCFLRSISVVAVCLVHQNNEVRKRSEIIKIRLTEIFGQATHTRSNGSTAFLCGFILSVELGDIEDIDFKIRE